MVLFIIFNTVLLLLYLISTTYYIRAVVDGDECGRNYKGCGVCWRQSKILRNSIISRFPETAEIAPRTEYKRPSVFHRI